MSKKDQRGARLRVRFREIQGEIRSQGEVANTQAIVTEARNSVTLSPQEEDWIWDGGWESRVKEAIRGVSTGSVRNIVSVGTNGARSYEQLVLLTFDQGEQVRDGYRNRSAEHERYAIGWERLLSVWAERGKDLRLGEALDSDEYGDAFGTASGQ